MQKKYKVLQSKVQNMSTFKKYRFQLEKITYIFWYQLLFTLITSHSCQQQIQLVFAELFLFFSSKTILNSDLMHQPEACEAARISSY